MLRIRKKLVIFTLLISLGLVVSGCFNKPQAVLVNENQNTNSDTAITTEEIDISDWKTYRNEEYGFEFKYPGDWNLDVCSEEDGINDVLMVLLDGSISCIGNLPDSKISVSLGESYNILTDQQIFNLVHYKEEDVVVGGDRFIKISGDLPYKDAEGNIVRNKWIKIIDMSVKVLDRDVYLVLRFHNIYGLGNTVKLENNINVYDNLIESFKFTQ